MRKTGLRPGTLQRLRAPDDYRSGAEFLKIRAEADKARYEREVPLTARAREALDEVCPNEGLIFPKFAWRYPLREAARTAGLEPDRASEVKP
jgi:integrase